MKDRVLIALAGPSASGKSHLARQIASVGLLRKSEVISLDCYLLEDQDNYDIPESIDWSKFEKDLDGLRIGNIIEISQTGHSLVRKSLVQWNDCLVVEGLFALTNDKLCEMSDMKIYLNTNQYLAGARRLYRDVVVYKDDPEYVMSLTLQPRGGCPVRIRHGGGT